MMEVKLKFKQNYTMLINAMNENECFDGYL